LTAGSDTANSVLDARGKVHGLAKLARQATVPFGYSPKGQRASIAHDLARVPAPLDPV
jgi:hypothetical protein